MSQSASDCVIRVFVNLFIGVSLACDGRMGSLSISPAFTFKVGDKNRNRCSAVVELQKASRYCTCALRGYNAMPACSANDLSDFLKDGAPEVMLVQVIDSTNFNSSE